MKDAFLRYRAMMITLMVLACVACGGDDEAVPSQPPTITAYEPSNGFPGANIVITGTNFGTNKDKVKVYFYDNAEAVVVEVAATSLTVTVPDNAYVGPIRVVVNGLEVAGSDFSVTGLCFYKELGYQPCPRIKPS